MSALMLWINIPLMSLAFAFWVGVPLWLVLRHPDVRTRENSTVPAYLVARQGAVHSQQRPRTAIRGYATAAN